MKYTEALEQLKMMDSRYVIHQAGNITTVIQLQNEQPIVLQNTGINAYGGWLWLTTEQEIETQSTGWVVDQLANLDAALVESVGHMKKLGGHKNDL